MLQVIWTPYNGVSRDITQQTGRIRWSGQYDAVARTLDIVVLRPRAFAGIEQLEIQCGDAIQLLSDGTLIFDGIIWTDSTDSASDTASYRCYDMGIYLKLNTTSYRCDALPPELAVADLAADMGFEVGVLAATGVTLNHTFVAQTVYQIIQTLYNRAAATTGDKYMQLFIGRSLHVIRRGMDSSTLVVQGGSNLLRSSVSYSLDDTVNRVRIINESLTPTSVRVDEDSVARYGLLTRDVSDAEGAGETAAALFTPEPTQDITVECLGDVRSITGRCIVIRDALTGLCGLYHINRDTHTWDGGMYTNQLTCSFDALVDDAEVGEAGETVRQTMDTGSSARYWRYME